MRDIVHHHLIYSIQYKKGALRINTLLPACLPSVKMISTRPLIRSRWDSITRKEPLSLLAKYDDDEDDEDARRFGLTSERTVICFAGT